MQLSFRRRLFLAMIGLGTVPLAIALLVLALQVRSAGSPTLDEIAQSGGELVGAVDTMVLDEQGRAAFRTHTETIAAQTTLARRAERLRPFAFANRTRRSPANQLCRPATRAFFGAFLPSVESRLGRRGLSAKPLGLLE